MELLILHSPCFLSAMGNCQYSTAAAFRMSQMPGIGLISVMETDFLKNTCSINGFLTSETCLELLLYKSGMVFLWDVSVRGVLHISFLHKFLLKREDTLDSSSVYGCYSGTTLIIKELLPQLASYYVVLRWKIPYLQCAK